MTNIIEQHLPEIQQLMRKYGVERAYAFGSVVKDNMSANSDVDFLISLPESMDYETYSNNYFNLANALEILLKKRVDLVAEETLTNPYLIESINRDKKKIL